MIPKLPDPRELADAVKEDAGREHLEPAAVEKDFHLTRLVWALGEKLEQKLLLKGGTCLSKVDLGYHRMSEDADFVLPWSSSLKSKGTNARATNLVRDALMELAPKLEMKLQQPDGEHFDRKSHVLWTLHYQGSFPPSSLVVEASLRPMLREPRRVGLRQLLTGTLAAPYSGAYCWALAEDEVRAEKVRAAFTREEPEIRDFYDLELLRRAGKDLAGKEFVALIDAKLGELSVKPLRQQPRSFGLGPERIDHLTGPGMVRLTSVVRANEQAFDLPAMLAAFNTLWGKQ